MSLNRALFLSTQLTWRLFGFAGEDIFASPRARRSLAGPRAMLGVDHGGRGLAAAAACVQSTVYVETAQIAKLRRRRHNRHREIMMHTQ